MSFFLYYFLPFILVIGILIFFHELGHFLMAKLFNVKVEKFSLGFGYKIFGKRFGETEYLISTIPLGGYVKLLGEEIEEMEDVPQYEIHRAFYSQHVLKRIIIVLAGPIFNILLGYIIFYLSFCLSGLNIMLPEVGKVREGSPAFRAGLKEGDLILEIDGIPIKSWEELKEIVKRKGQVELSIKVKREGEILNFKVTPELSRSKNIFGEEIKTPLIGIVASGRYKSIDVGPIEAIKLAFLKVGDLIYLTFLILIKIFEGVVSIKTLGGPILIGQMTGQLAQKSFSYIFPFMAVISVNLAILNLLPIPVLDGGLLMFFIIELVLGRPIGIKKREFAQKVGMVILGLLIVIVTINDLSRVGIFKIDAIKKVIQYFRGPSP